MITIGPSHTIYGINLWCHQKSITWGYLIQELTQTLNSALIVRFQAEPTNTMA